MIRIWVLAVILFSCSQKTKVPDTILPPEKMEKLLMDMLRTEELLNKVQIDSTLKDSVTRFNLYQSVLAFHKTDKENFKKSFTYYENHPNLLKPILDSMYAQASKKTDTTIKMPAKLKKISKK
jgi:hypothetical protein